MEMKRPCSSDYLSEEEEMISKGGSAGVRIPTPFEESEFAKLQAAKPFPWLNSFSHTVLSQTDDQLNHEGPSRRSRRTKTKGTP